MAEKVEESQEKTCAVCGLDLLTDERLDGSVCSGCWMPPELCTHCAAV
ncbi:MAG: hypothetical protein OK439_00205 [Thaumarchaeota archaeon]|nr:hypothetical protein [Nitrososphaerota archaeon]